MEKRVPNNSLGFAEFEVWGEEPVTTDLLAPIVQITAPEAGDYANDRQLTISLTASDAESGMDPSRTLVTLDGSEIVSDQPIELYTLPLGAHTVTTAVYDQAGNRLLQHLDFTTFATIDSLQYLVDLFTHNGGIGNQGIATSLVRKLESGQLPAFMNEVKAQRGKHIAEDAADVLLRDAASIRE